MTRMMRRMRMRKRRTQLVVVVVVVVLVLVAVVGGWASGWVGVGAGELRAHQCSTTALVIPLSLPVPLSPPSTLTEAALRMMSHSSHRSPNWGPLHSHVDAPSAMRDGRPPQRFDA